MRTGTLIGAAAVVVIAAGAVYAYLRSGSGGLPEAPLATPPGVTLQNMVFQQPMPFVILNLGGRAPLRFGGPSGLTAYITDKDDQPGKSSCEGACADEWPPILAPAGASPFGDWSIVTRGDGARQWAYRGKPLYTSKKDKGWGLLKGDGADGVWHVAKPVWNGGAVLPPGLGIAEVAEAAGQVLVDDRGMALYAFSGDVDSDQTKCAAGPCAHRFIPFEAPQAALPIGDFSTMTRRDGIQQWAYKGKPLYTYDGDVRLGDANGKGVDQRFRLAMVARYFVPAEVKLRPDEARGGVWTTPNGHTIYVRESFRYTANGSHSARGGETGLQQVGMAVGLLGCDAECEKNWPPVKAPSDAQPSGYWTVLQRPDGSKQWAYQGYALYTFTGDKKPGDALSADDYNVLRVNDPVQRAALDQYGPGLYWRVATP
jgi:predicted lipoprotein with Yx(FWY)xxD motif